MRPAACARDATDASLRCLIVDDNAYFLEAAADLLTRPGMTVADVASDTAGALRMASDLHPFADLMITTSQPLARICETSYSPIAGFSSSLSA